MVTINLKDNLHPTAGYSVTVKVKLQNILGTFAGITDFLRDNGASCAELVLIYADFNIKIRKITIACQSEAHAKKIVEGIRDLDGCELLEWQDDTFSIHEGGKLEIHSKSALDTADQLSRAYTPGVARVCTVIAEDRSKAFKYTIKHNSVAVVTDGSAVLGLGNIGPEGALPVMEGKAVLFKRFANIDAFPICLATQDTEEIIQTVKNIAPVFGGINLEDISAPRCFEVEDRLSAELDIPVFHDDQHGTAVVMMAGVINALKIVKKELKDIKAVISGFGAGGVACTRMLMAAGVKNILACDRAGIVYEGRTENMNAVKLELSKLTNPDNEKGDLAHALEGADLLIGVSGPGLVTRDMIKKMAKDPIVFALANPVPEIMPDEIFDLVKIIATGRSDYPNQVNNVLCFPGIFKGAFDAGAPKITEAMQLAAAHAIADSVEGNELKETFIIPSVFSGDIGTKVARKVMESAIQEGIAIKKRVTPY